MVLIKGPKRGVHLRLLTPDHSANAVKNKASWKWRCFQANILDKIIYLHCQCIINRSRKLTKLVEGLI